MSQGVAVESGGEGGVTCIYKAASGWVVGSLNSSINSGGLANSTSGVTGRRGQGARIWPKSRSDWLLMGQIREFFR